MISYQDILKMKTERTWDKELEWVYNHKNHLPYILEKVFTPDARVVFIQDYREKFYKDSPYWEQSYKRGW